mgnify:CR=1 FL=1
MKRYMIKLIIRITVFVIVLLGYLFDRERLFGFMMQPIKMGVTPLHLLWLMFMVMMIAHIFPTDKLTMALRKSQKETYEKTETYSKEELYEGIKEGILVTDVAGLHAGLNVVAGTFNLQSSGYMIRNGKKAEPITLFVVSGNFFDMLNNVEKIGNDLPEKINDIAIPSLLVKGLMISGK